MARARLECFVEATEDWLENEEEHHEKEDEGEKTAQGANAADAPSGPHQLKGGNAKVRGLRFVRSPHVVKLPQMRLPARTS